MAAATRAELRARIEAILDDITGLTLLTGREALVSRSTLPAFEVRRPTVTRHVHAARQILVTLRYPIWVLVQEMPDMSSDTDLDTALDACELWQETIAAALEAKPRLERNDTGLVFGMGDLELSAPGGSN